MQRRVTLFVALVLTLALSSSLAAARQVKKKSPNSRAEQKMTTENAQADAPFACSLIALNAAERTRHRELSETLHRTVKEIRELPNGYAFKLPGERQTIAMVAEWISFERLCCPFFSFQLEIASEGTPIWLRMTGREGVKQFMQSEFDIK